MPNYEDVTELLIEQYKNSENFRNYLNSMSEQYLEISDVATQIDTRRRLQTASGQNLDDLGDIIGFARPSAQDVSRFFSFFGGAGRGFTNVAGTVLGGEWASISGGEGSSPISDSQYRAMLELKIKVNQSTGTPNEIINSVFEYSGVYPRLTEGVASIDLEIIGASSIDVREFYENFLPRPLGVSLTVTDLPLIGSSVITGDYTGTGALQKVPFIPSGFIDIGFMLWIKSHDNTGDLMIYADVLGVKNTFACNDETPVKDIGITLLESDGFTIDGTSPDCNQVGIQYEFFILPMTRKEEFIIPETNKPVEWYINDYTGFMFGKYQGAVVHQILEVPNNKPITLAGFKDYKNGGAFSAVSSNFGGNITNTTVIDISNELPPRLEIGFPFIQDRGIEITNGFNEKDTDYFIWALSQAQGYITVSNYVGDGNLGRLISVGIQPILVMVRKISDSGNWVFVTDNFPSTNTLSMNLKDGFDVTDKLTLDPLGFIVSNDTDVNELNAEYFYLVVKQ